jgi:uncharacterized protein DUF4129
MTSRQPEAMPPGTTGHAAIPGGGGPRDDRGTAGARHRLVSTPRWPVLVLPLTLMIIVALTGLRGELTGLRWDGPLHGDPVPVGIALEVVLGIMLAITTWRYVIGAHAGTVEAAPASAVAVKLRRVLVFVLSVGMIAVAAIILVGLPHHLFSGRAKAGPGQAPASAAPSSATAQSGWHFFPKLHLHAPSVLLYVLLVLLFVGLVAVRIYWARWFQPSGPRRAYRYTGADSQDLREVVESGRSALYAVDDARAAIIACYVAMETSLAEHGAARAIGDTPDELLRRATASGIVRGTAAARLTTLFYEARFSSHPLVSGQRDAAGRALGELAALLAEAEASEATAPAGRPGRRSRANRHGVRT